MSREPQIKPEGREKPEAPPAPPKRREVLEEFGAPIRPPRNRSTRQGSVRVTTPDVIRSPLLNEPEPAGVVWRSVVVGLVFFGGFWLGWVAGGAGS